MPSPSLSDIANRVGVSKMTVSRVLRGEPHVSQELRENVLRMAEEMGYRPDPEIAKLMTHMRQARRTAAPRTLAFVWAERGEEEVSRSAWSALLIQGARARAERLGFRLDEFHLAAKGMNGRRLSEILEARGIPGLILSPLISRTRGYVAMKWERFSSVVIGLGFARPALHRVHHHHYLGMLTALRQLAKLGYKRIGFFCPATLSARMYEAWAACFLAHHPLPLAQAAELRCITREPSRQEFRRWLEKTRPEVVIDGGHSLLDWMEPGEVPTRLGYATLGWRPDMAHVSGLDQQANVLGAAAVDLLVAQFQQNERGIPTHPKMVMTEGRWVEGGTLLRP